MTDQEKIDALRKALRFYARNAPPHSLYGICHCPTRRRAVETLNATEDCWMPLPDAPLIVKGGV